MENKLETAANLLMSNEAKFIYLHHTHYHALEIEIKSKETFYAKTQWLMKDKTNHLFEYKMILFIESVMQENMWFDYADSDWTRIYNILCDSAKHISNLDKTNLTRIVYYNLLKCICRPCIDIVQNVLNSVEVDKSMKFSSKRELLGHFYSEISLRQFDFIERVKIAPRADERVDSITEMENQLRFWNERAKAYLDLKLD